MSKRSDAIEAARMLEAQGSDFNTIVALLVERMGVQPEQARSIAAQVCKAEPRRRRGQVFVRHPSISR